MLARRPLVTGGRPRCLPLPDERAIDTGSPGGQMTEAARSGRCRGAWISGQGRLARSGTPDECSPQKQLAETGEMNESGEPGREWEEPGRDWQSTRTGRTIPPAAARRTSVPPSRAIVGTGVVRSRSGATRAWQSRPPRASRTATTCLAHGQHARGQHAHVPRRLLRDAVRALVRARAIIGARAGLGRLERATTPGPDPAGESSATTRGIRLT
jgi:hypothetical protein